MAELGVSTARELSRQEALPVNGALRELFPQGIRRGSTIAVTSTSLMLLLLSTPTQAGSWAAIAGFSSVGVVAAQELGVELKRCAFVPYYSSNSVTKVIAVLIDAVDFVVVHRANNMQIADARRLVARARERKCVLILSKTSWPNITPLTLRIASSSWQRAANGFGRLQGRRVEVTAGGRGAMSRPLHSSIWLGETEYAQKTDSSSPPGFALSNPSLLCEQIVLKRVRPPRAVRGSVSDCVGVKRNDETLAFTLWKRITRVTSPCLNRW
jgi:hypothetical protein